MSKIKKLSEQDTKELKEKALYVLTDTRKKLLQSFPFIGAIAMNLDLVPVRDARLSTAATDGAAIYFDIDFLSKLSADERLFVIAHEVYHNVMMHSLRKEDRNHKLFNVATDMEINQLLMHDGLKICKNGLTNKTYNFPPDLSAEEYYDLLTKYNKQNSGGASSEFGNSDDDSSQDGSNGRVDKHIYKDDEVESVKQSVDKYGEKNEDTDYRPNVTQGNVDKIRQATVAAAQLVEKQFGTLPSHLKNIVNELTKPRVDWRTVLSQFVTRNSGESMNTWNNPNRRFSYQNLYLPSRQSNKMKLAVILDTSGSVTEILPQFLGELSGLIKSFGNYELTVIQNDADVQDVKTYNDESTLDLENTKFEVHGFGGTNLTPAFKYLSDNTLDVDCVLAMTDGYFEKISADCCQLPTLWLVTDNGTEENISFGDIVSYTND